jgi:hypothetical protein
MRIERGITWTRLQGEALSEGYKLSGYYVNSRSELLVECPNGHSYQVQAQTWMGGHRCSHCSTESRAKSMQLTEQDCKDRLRSDGYTLLSPYKSYQGAIKVKCDRGHYWQTTLKNFSLGHRCPTCNRLKRQSQI